jgi:hypothetical protein
MIIDLIVSLTGQFAFNTPIPCRALNEGGSSHRQSSGDWRRRNSRVKSHSHSDDDRFTHNHRDDFVPLIATAFPERTYE